MIHFSRFYAEHLLTVRLQEDQEGEASVVDLATAKALEGSVAFSGFVSGECVGCAGLIDLWDGRAMAWAFLSQKAGRHMGAITRFARDTMFLHRADRIEASVRCEFAAGHRWLRLIGFECEAPRMRKYDPAGRDYALYAKVRP